MRARQSIADQSGTRIVVGARRIDRRNAHEIASELNDFVRGSIDFVLGDGRTLTLRPGDRMLLPAGTRHAALVGLEGCACIEGKV